MLNRARRISRGDDGITLMELVVAMSLTTILGAIATYFFVITNHAAGKSIVNNYDTGDARETLDSWTTMLRSAGWQTATVPFQDRFEEITPTKIVFFANLNNRATPAPTATTITPVSATTKVSLSLVTTNPTTGEGKLVEVVFAANNTTPLHVRQLGFNAMPTGGAGFAVFQPSYYRQVGNTAAPVDVTTTLGCVDGSGTPVPGLCLQTPPAAAGMIDPTIPASGALVPTSGPLRGNPSNNVDVTLNGISSVKIAFTVTDENHLVSMDFASSASVNSGVSP